MNQFVRTSVIIAMISVVILTSKGISEQIQEYYNHCISVLASNSMGTHKLY